MLCWQMANIILNIGNENGDTGLWNQLVIYGDKSDIISRYRDDELSFDPNKSFETLESNKFNIPILFELYPSDDVTIDTMVGIVQIDTEDGRSSIPGPESDDWEAIAFGKKLSKRTKDGIELGLKENKQCVLEMMKKIVDCLKGKVEDIPYKRILRVMELIDAKY